MKKLAVFALVLICAAGYIGCGGSSNSSPTAPVITTPNPGTTPPPNMTPVPTPTPY